MSVVLAMMQFSSRATRVGSRELLASHDLVGLSVLYAGLVTISVAWMALSPTLIAGYATLFGIYFAGHAWVLAFAGGAWLQAIVRLLMAAAALLAAYLVWSDETEPPPSGEE